MATTTPLAYNPTADPISGTTQVGQLAVGTTEQDYSISPGGVTWWMGPDEDLGYVIGVPVSGNTQPTEISGVSASVGFFRSEDLTDNSFINIAEYVANEYGSPQTFSSASDASDWLTNNGFWNTFIPVTPTPTPTNGITQTPTNTPTETPTNTPTPTVTVTPTETPTPTNTPTPTPTSGATGDFTVTVSQVGPDVVWSGSGSFNTTSLISNGTDELTAGFSAPNAAWAIGDPTPPGPALDVYSGVTTFPTSFGTAGGTIGTLSGSGDTFGIIPNGTNRNLLVPTGYTSGSFISGSTTYAGATIAGMNLTPGTYTWSWGTGGNVSTLVMTINS